MQDLSSILPGDPVSVLTGSSMAAGNMTSDNKNAMTAPGSKPTDPLQPASEQGDPHITVSDGPHVTPGTDGKPQASKSPGYSPGPPAWKNTH